jgi:hypothetical protein
MKLKPIVPIHEVAAMATATVTAIRIMPDITGLNAFWSWRTINSRDYEDVIYVMNLEYIQKINGPSKNSKVCKRQGVASNSCTFL